MKRISLLCLIGLMCTAVWAAPDMAPALPDLTLPAEGDAAAEGAAAKSAPKKSAPKKSSSRSGKNRKTSRPPITNTASRANNEEVVVENLIDDTVVEPVKLSAAEVEKLLPPLPAPSAELAAAQTASPAPVPAKAEAKAEPAAEPAAFAPVRDEKQPVAQNKTAETKVAYNPASDRDPTLSPDDSLLIKHREEERLRAIEAERQRKINEERRRLAEIERQRQLELERLRDPSREIRGKIRINGIIGQEVFIGNKVYTVGKTVLGARIIQVQPDAVVFQYKGQKFTKKVQLK